MREHSAATHRPELPALPRPQHDNVAPPEPLLGLAPLGPGVLPVRRAPPPVPPLPPLSPLLLLLLLPRPVPLHTPRPTPPPRRKAPALTPRVPHPRPERALEPRPQAEVAREVDALALERARASPRARCRSRRHSSSRRRRRERPLGGARPAEVRLVVVRSGGARRAAPGAGPAPAPQDDGRRRVGLRGGEVALCDGGREGEALAPEVVQTGGEGDDGRCGGAERGREGRGREAVQVDGDEG